MTNFSALVFTNNTGTTTASNITLGGGSNTGNSFAPATTDLLFVGTGATTTFQNGATGALNIVLGQSGNFDILGTATISSAISDGGNAFGITKTGTGTLTLGGTNTFSGGLAINAGVVSVTAAGAVGTGTISFGGGTLTSTIATDFSTLFSQAANQAYSFSNSAATTFATALTSSGGTFAKSGASTLTLTAANTFTGATTINTGSIILSGAGALASTTINLSSTTTGGGLLLTNTGAGNNAVDRIADNASINLNSGSFVLGGSDQSSTNVAESVGTINVTANGVNGATSIITVSPGTSGTPGATKLTASSISRSTGGNIALVNGTGLGSSTTSNSQFLVTTAPTLIGTTTPSSGGINSASQNTQIVPGLVGEATTTTGGLGTVTSTANTFLTYTAAGGLRPLNPTDEFTNNVITAGNNTRITAATMMASSTAINSLVVSGNNLTLTAGTAATPNTLTDTSGALLFTSTNNIVGTATTTLLSFGANEGLIYNSNAAAIASAAQIQTAVSGSAGITKSGPGSLRFTQPITLSGGIFTDAQGFVQFDGANNFTGASISLSANGSILFLNNYNGFSGASGVSVSNNAQIRFIAAATYNTPASFANTPTTLSGGGNLFFNSPGNNNSYIYPGAITLGSNGISTIQSYNAGNNYVSVSGGISSTTGLTSAGVNYQTDGSGATNDHLIYVTGTQNYTGVTQFTAGNANGRIVLGAALPTASVINMTGTTAARTQQVDLYGLNQTVAGLQSLNTTAVSQIINSNATSATLTVNNTNNYVFGGNIGTVGAVNTGGTTSTGTIFSAQNIIIATTTGNNLGLTKSGTGTLTLIGANSFTGPTSITGGTLALSALNGAVAANIGLNTSSGVSVSGTGALTLNVLGALSDTGTLTMTSGATLNLNSLTGTETIAALILDGNPVAANTYTAAQLNAMDGGAVFFTSLGETLTIAPVPEPSTYVGGLLLVGAFVWHLRSRRRQVA